MECYTEMGAKGEQVGGMVSSTTYISVRLLKCTLS